MFEFIVLIETAFRAIGFAANLDATFVVSLNLVCVPTHPLDLIIDPLALTVELLVLNK